MSAILKHMHTAVLFAAVLAVGAESVSAQATKDRVRRRRTFAAQTGPDQVTLAWDQVPGATEYRIYLPDPASPGPPTPDARPLTTSSASGRQAIIPGVKRLSNGAYLVAMKGRQVLLQEKFEAVTRAPLARPVAPAAVSAQETGETEVTVSWDPVPGASAYVIGRAAGGSGLRMLCSLCPPEAVFVDTAAVPGLDHLYTVQAIFPLGVSGRTTSNTLTVGAAQLAAAGPPAGAISDKPMASGTPVAGTAADNTNVGASAGTATSGTGTPPTGTGTVTGTTPTYTPPGQPAGTTSTYTPPGQPAGTTPTYTPPGQPASTLPTTSTPVTATPTSPVLPAEQITTLVQRIGDRLTSLLGSVASGATVHPATPVSTGTTSDPLATLVTSIKSNLSELLGNVMMSASGGSTATHTATAVSTTSSTSTDPLISLVLAIRDKVANVLGAVGAGSSLASTTSSTGATSPVTALLDGIKSDVSELMGAVGAGSLAGSAFSTGTTVHQATPISGSTPTTATPAPGAGTVTACRLDYQRADNMWAAFGRPDGQLGTESISLAPGQNRVFVTDWKYEKQRNDGANFYGSHLRIATNPTARPVRLQLRTTTVTGLVIFTRTGSNTFWIRLDPNASRQFQADLMEVFCEI